MISTLYLAPSIFPLCFYLMPDAFVFFFVVLHKLTVVCTDLSMLNVMLPNVMLYKCHVCCHFRLGLQVLEFHFSLL